jgi:hypothetical protein
VLFMSKVCGCLVWFVFGCGGCFVVLGGLCLLVLWLGCCV